MNQTLEEQLRETYAERDAGYDPSQALGRLLATSYDPEVSRRRPSWPLTQLRWRSTRTHGRFAAVTVVVVAVTVAVTVVLAGGGSAPRPLPSASDVIARTAAFVTGSGNGILHVEATTTVVHNGKRGSSVFDNWSEEAPPYDNWSLALSASGKLEIGTTVVGNTITTYQADWNQISVGNSRTGPMPAQLGDPLVDAILRLVPPGHGIVVPESRLIASATAFSELLAELIKEPGVTVDQDATLNGGPAIAIRSSDRQGTLYVEPGNYRPLEFVAATEGPPDGHRITMRTTTVFKTYETLPNGSVHVPNLVLEYPHATVAPWEMSYWKQYWSRASSGNAETRQRALDDLRDS